MHEHIVHAREVLPSEANDTLCLCCRQNDVKSPDKVANDAGAASEISAPASARCARCLGKVPKALNTPLSQFSWLTDSSKEVSFIYDGWQFQVRCERKRARSPTTAAEPPAKEPEAVVFPRCVGGAGRMPRQYLHDGATEVEDQALQDRAVPDDGNDNDNTGGDSDASMSDSSENIILSCDREAPKTKVRDVIVHHPLC